MDRSKNGDSFLDQSGGHSARKRQISELQTEDGRDPSGSGCLDDVKGLKIGRQEIRWLVIQKKVQTILKSSFQFPIQDICKRRVFRNDVDLSNPMNRPHVESALEDFLIDINAMSLRQFYEMYGDSEKHIFDTSRYELKQYYNMQESIDVLTELLEFQFHGEEEKIKEFLTKVVDIIDRRVAKMNTMVICSPPSAGKNYFLDCIFNILVNIGYLGTANKTNQFAFQEAPDKRCLVWNEVNYEPAMDDMCKQLTGGDTCKVRVKNKPDTYVTRTPLFCMVNQSIPFMYELPYAERCVSFLWEKADFLAKHKKYPYPSCIFQILKNYDIDF